MKRSHTGASGGLCEDAHRSTAGDDVRRRPSGRLSLGNGLAKCKGTKAQYLQVTDDVSRVTRMSLKKVLGEKEIT